LLGAYPIGPFQAQTQAYLSLCGARRLAQGSIGGSARTLFAGFQPLIKVVYGELMYRPILPVTALPK